MIRVVMIEQLNLDEWNEKRMKENDQDEDVDGMKQYRLAYIYTHKGHNPQKFAKWGSTGVPVPPWCHGAHNPKKLH